MRRRIRNALLVLLVLLALAAAALYAPDRPVSALQARWAAPPSELVPIAGMQVHLRDEGPPDDPLPVVLLHGTSASLHTWDGWAAALRDEHRVLRFDLPGFGLTGPSKDGDYRAEAYVRFVLAVLDARGVQRCVLAGNSLGGMIAWETAVAAPERVERLVLVDSAGYPPAARHMPLGFRLARTPGLSAVVPYVLTRGLIERSLRAVYGDPSRITPELVDRYYELTLREGNRRAVVQRFEQYPSGPRADHIREVKQPTLILWGAKDGTIPVEHAQLFHRDIPGSEVVVFDALGHVPQEEDPAATVAPVRAMLAQSSTASAQLQRPVR